MSMKLHIPAPAYKTIGALRVSEKVFSKIEKIAKSKGCTNQDVIRAILEQVIEDIE